MSRYRPFNINHHVKVKLNQRGLDALRKQAEEYRKINPNYPEFREPKTDEEGYATFQLWSLMHDLGHLCEMGLEPPFETRILVECEGEPADRTIQNLRHRLEHWRDVGYGKDGPPASSELVGRLCEDVLDILSKLGV